MVYSLYDCSVCPGEISYSSLDYVAIRDYHVLILDAVKDLLGVDMKHSLRLWLILIVALLATPAYARRHVVIPQVDTSECADTACVMSGVAGRGQLLLRPTPVGRIQRGREGRGIILAHPSGCPRRLFCGCGASIEIFGRPIARLFTARAWFGFPRSERAPGTAMVRAHHVAILKSHVSGTLWMVYDANSGGRQTRLHVRDTAGWTIVNPTRGA